MSVTAIKRIREGAHLTVGAELRRAVPWAVGLSVAFLGLTLFVPVGVAAVVTLVASLAVGLLRAEGTPSAAPHCLSPLPALRPALVQAPKASDVVVRTDRPAVA